MKIWGNNFFSQNIAPGGYIKWVEKQHLIPDFKLIENSTTFVLPESQLETLVDEIKKDLKEQADRKKGLEDKIKAILFAVSLSITAITFCLKDVKLSLNNWMDIIALVLIGLSILYFYNECCISIKVNNAHPILHLPV